MKRAGRGSLVLALICLAVVVWLVVGLLVVLNINGVMGMFGRKYSVMLPEAGPSLLIGATVATTTILGYSALSGIVGGGGLGAIAINYGYYRRTTDIMMVAVVLLVLLVQLVQEFGGRIARRSDRRLT